MKISELSAEYRDSAMLCRGRIKELNLKLEGEPMCEIDRLRLRRRTHRTRGLCTGAEPCIPPA